MNIYLNRLLLHWYVVTPLINSLENTQKHYSFQTDIIRSLAHESSSFIVNVPEQKSDHVTTANFLHRVRYELQFLLPITTLQREIEKERGGNGGMTCFNYCEGLDFRERKKLACQSPKPNDETFSLHCSSPPSHFYFFCGVQFHAEKEWSK